MKTLPHGLRVFAPMAMLITLSIGCGKHTNPVQLQGPQTQNLATGGVAGTAANTPSSQGATVPSSGPSTREEAVVSQPASITIPRGTRLAVRMGQTIDVKHATPGQSFDGTVIEPVVVGNTVAIPVGAAATGKVLAAHRRGHFKGRSILALTLTRLEINGTEYRIATSDLMRTKKGKGKRSTALIGGGAGLGMLIGGIASGGVGLLAGGLAGGGAGTLGAAFTGNRDITIPAESVVRFRLENNLTLTPSVKDSQPR